MVAAAVGAASSACSSVPEEYERGLSAWRAEQPTNPSPDVGAAGAAGVLPRDDLGPGSSLADHLALAAERNAAVREARQLWRAALERVPQATSLDDPRLTVGWFVAEVETRAGPMDGRIGLSQSFPWFGTLDLAGKVAVLGAEAAREAVAERRLAAEHAVRDVWHELAYLSRAVAITEEHLAILSDWEELARTRYATGVGEDADVIRAQVELGKLDDRLATLRDLRRPLEARLNAALDRPARATVGVPTLDDGSIDALDEEAVVAALDETSPHLRGLARRRDAAELAVELADKRNKPDFSIGVDYTAIGAARMGGVRDSGDDAVALTFGIDLPIRRERYAAAEAQAAAEHAASRAALAAARNERLAELEMAFYAARDADRRVALYLGALVPKGRQSLESVLVAYQADAADFFELLDAERVLLEFQLAAARARADRAQALATIARLTGVDPTETGP